jgi:chromosome segregation ATPase
MNKKQRERIEQIESALTDLKDELDGFADEEQEKFDNLSEGLQASERGQAFESNADTLKEVVSSLDDAISSLGSVV